MKQEELEAKLKRRKEKGVLGEESFIDREMIYSFGISAIVHLIILYWGWYGLMYFFGPSYDRLVRKMNATPDIILRLKPGKTEKGEFSFREAEKYFDLKKDEN